MTDPKQTVDRIRSFLDATDQTNMTELTQWASDYAELCRETNTRLRRCSDYMRQGLRSEALQYADCVPSLLGLVSTLDLPDIAAWEETCASYELTRPMRLMTDAAKTLNEAYAEQEPIRPLLAKHRMLAITNAPLPERLSILRKLAAADPISPCWAESIVEFETARFSTLRTEASAAIKARDMAWVDRLLTELTGETWHSPIPEVLKDSLSKASHSFHCEDALIELKGMIPRIREAYASMNETECRDALAKWMQVVKGAKLTVPAELREEISPLNNWLNDQDDRKDYEKRFEAACAELTTAMDTNTNDVELKGLYRTVVDFGRAIPEGIETEYRVKLDAYGRERQIERRRQFAVAFVLVAAVALALGALAYVMITSGKH